MEFYYVDWKPVDYDRWITECFTDKTCAKNFIKRIKKLNPLVEIRSK